MNNTIISIDWDHTFRNMAGIDLGILALVLYAQSQHIPVGLTTHRDLENTTLYTLAYAQYRIPEEESDALAAAISYWDKHVFKPLNIYFDFINARYQVRYETGNYYQDKLLELEKKLAEEIIQNRILDNPKTVQEKVAQYAKAEEPLLNNEYKEAQILWLSEQFAQSGTLPTIYHIDDNQEVYQQLAHQFSHVHTIFYQHSPLFSNQSCIPFVTEIGLLNDMQAFATGEWPENPLRGLSLCLAMLQVVMIDDALFDIIEKKFQDLKSAITPDLIRLYAFIEGLLLAIKTKKQPIYLLNNDLSWGDHHHTGVSLVISQ